jgi:AraC-like DNA-binding protein
MIEHSDSLADRLTRWRIGRELTDPRNWLPARLTRGVPLTGGTTVYRMEPFGDVLDLSRVRGALLCYVHAAAPWGLDVPGTGGASVHVVTGGTAWLRVGRDQPAQLTKGDVFLLPSGVEYRMSSTPDGPCQRFDARLKARMTPERDLEIGGGGARTTFLCAEYVYDLDVAQPLMSLLPTVLLVPADPAGGGRVAPIVELLASEVNGHSPGSRAAVARLLDLLLIEGIRHWIHPLAYLTRWRMYLAAARLKHTSDTVEVIAHEVGYTSEHAFNRAFARHRGQPPGRYRRLARTG